MRVFHKILPFLFLLATFICLGLIFVPQKFLGKPKKQLYIFLYDVSLSHPLQMNIGQTSQVFSEELKSNGFFLLKGAFADKAILLDEKPVFIKGDEADKEVDGWLKSLDGLRKLLDENQTDFSGTIMSLVKDYQSFGQMHFVFFSDGKETSGSVQRLNSLLQNLGATCTFIENKNKINDVQIADVELPSTYLPNKPLQAIVKLRSTGKFASARLMVSSNQSQIYQKDVSIDIRLNQFVIALNFEGSGLNSLEFKVEVEDDIKENNFYFRSVYASEQKKVLIFSEGSATSLKSLFPDAQIKIPLELFSNYSDYTAFQTVILNNIHGRFLADKEKWNALESYVKKGGQLLVVGGDQSFGMGDYMAHPIETLLPVHINPNGLVSLYLLLDASGSMEDSVAGVRKMDIALSNILELVSVLGDRDKIALHLFQENKLVDDLWISSHEKKVFVDTLQKKLKTAPLPKGGTFILPALTSVEKFLEKDDKELRIVLLLTDGLSNEVGFKEVFQQLQSKLPKVGFLLIGAGMNDRATLISDAKQVWGDDWSWVNIDEFGWVNIKECFEKALQNISSGFIGKGPVNIYAIKTHPMVKNVEQSKGLLEGQFIKTNIKSIGSSLYLVDDYFPLIAHRYYEQGEVMSLQLGFSASWSENWFNGAQGKEALGVIKGWVNRDFQHRGFIASSWQEGQLILKLHFPFSKKLLSPQMMMSCKELEIHFTACGANTFESIIDDAKVCQKILQYGGEKIRLFQKNNNQLDILYDDILPQVMSLEMESIFWDQSKPKALSRLSTLRNLKNGKLAESQEILQHDYADSQWYVFLAFFFYFCYLLLRSRIR